MAELPFMPVATDALIADTVHMSAEEFGAYVRILCAMWRSRGLLDDAPGQLARIAGIGPKRWGTVGPHVMALMRVEGGKVSQKRLLATWDFVQNKRRKRAEAANKRWQPTK